MSSKFICHKCGAENIISGFSTAGAEKRCAVCGALHNQAGSTQNNDTNDSLEPDTPINRTMPPGRQDLNIFGQKRHSTNTIIYKRPEKHNIPLNGKIIIALIFLTFIITTATSNKYQNRKLFVRTKLKSCIENMKYINSAQIIYIMNETKNPDKNRSEKLTIELLKKKGHLFFIPICPESGKYTFLKKEDLLFYDIECSKHGKLSNLEK